MLKRDTQQFLQQLSRDKRFDKEFEKLDSLDTAQFSDEILEKLAVALSIEMGIKHTSVESIDTIVWFLKLAKVMG
jgi:acyl carrier protein